MKKLIWTCAVWGRAYLDLLETVHLPSLMSPGNFPALKHPIDSIIYTTPADAIEVGRIIEPMKRHGQPQVISVEDWPPPIGLAAVVGTQHHVLQQAWREDAGILHTSPDTAIGDGGYATVATRIAEGYRACMVMGVGAIKSSLQSELKSRGTAGVPGLDLMRLGLAHIHPFSRSAEWQSPQFINTPSMIHFVENGCRALHAFHLHPVFLYPRRLTANFRYTFDSDFMDVSGLAREEIMFLDRPGEFTVVELLSLEEKAFEIPPARTASVEGVVAWARRVTTPMNRWFFSHRLMISGAPDTPMPETDRIVEQISRELTPPPK